MERELISKTDRDVISGPISKAVMAALVNMLPGYQGKIVIKINIQINTATGGGATINV